MSDSHGQRRRQEILFAAADLSTAVGLDNLSFSRLAEEVGLSKAGVAAHFKSKEALQLAVVALAAAAYEQPIRAAALQTAPGFSRFRAIAQAWYQHLEAIDYRGGCFFAAAAQAFAGTAGPVRDAVAGHTRRLLDVLEEQAMLARRLGELRAEVDPKLLTFEVHALTQEANLRRELLHDEQAFATARSGLDALLAHAVVNKEIKGGTKS